MSLETADPATGEVRTIIEESCATYCEATPSLASRPNVRVLGGGDEVLWWSERDGWGHLYLYDGRTGELKRQVTSGPWLVGQVMHVDEAARRLWFTASGREGGDPYYMQLYSVGLDGGEVRRLTSEDSHHLVMASPGGGWFVDTYGRTDTAPVTVLRDRSGAVVMTRETGSLEGLEALSWNPPEMVVTKARDGVTDLYGLIVKPTGFDPEAVYPVIDYVYPGPQTAWVPKSIADPLSRVLWGRAGDGGTGRGRGRSGRLRQAPALEGVPQCLVRQPAGRRRTGRPRFVDQAAGGFETLDGPGARRRVRLLRGRIHVHARHPDPAGLLQGGRFRRREPRPARLHCALGRNSTTG